MVKNCYKGKHKNCLLLVLIDILNDKLMLYERNQIGFCQHLKNLYTQLAKIHLILPS